MLVSRLIVEFNSPGVIQKMKQALGQAIKKVEDEDQPNLAEYLKNFQNLLDQPVGTPPKPPKPDLKLVKG